MASTAKLEPGGDANDVAAELLSTQREFAQRTAVLARREAELREFTYIVTHDLKEPLRAISNFSQILSNECGEQLGDQGQSWLTTIQASAVTMQLRIDGLRRLSKLNEAPHVPVQMELMDVVRETLEDLADHLEEHNVDVVIRGALPIVSCDGDRVRELLTNLVVNAVQYSNADEKRVVIGHDPTRRTAPFYVRDNGIGIDPKHATGIFRVFRRLHRRDKYGGGIGMGLALAKSIVERHGGRIWVESIPGAGATFYFTLAEDKS